MKDMVMLLQWIQKNIKHFGGDPDNVTLLGNSSAAPAIHYLMMSPMSKGRTSIHNTIHSTSYYECLLVHTSYVKRSTYRLRLPTR